VVREAAGVAAYLAGEYADALAQFRAARRISGSDAYWPMMADCERGLGRPEKAIAMAGAPEVERLDRAGKVEMRIVASGARRDLGQLDAAVVTLQCPELSSRAVQPWSARIKAAYADALEAAGRGEEARSWWAKAAELDVDGDTDAAERLADLEGLVWTDVLDGEDDVTDEQADEQADGGVVVELFGSDQVSDEKADQADADAQPSTED
jgi:tetratricopeptide (TPR) repeat protein